MAEKNKDATAGRETTGPKKQGRAGKKQRNPWIGRTLIGAVVLAILIPLGTFLAAYVMVDVPEPEELPSPQVSQIMASDSTTELARIVPPEGNRSQVSVDEISDYVKNAVLAAEDREFYTNPGFSITGFARAVLGQITGDASAGGGSTITQQYVKKTLVGDEHSYVRKARELVYSVKMTNEWSKDEILGAYLNTVYFGRNAYGVEAAAQAYFNKPVAELGPEEAAVLAASIQLPSQLDPWTNPEGAQSRWSYVLDGMVDIGTLSPEERAAVTYPETRDPATVSAYTEATGPNGLIKNQVMTELASVGITEDEVNTRGLVVTTTIDPEVQAATVESVENNMSGQNDNIRTAAVSMDPTTGAVRGYYGGEDAGGWDYANAGLQTGSTFKIFGLAAALQQGIPLSTLYDSGPVTIPGGITISNVGGGSCGACSIAEALKFSHNTSFIRLQQDLENETQDTADMAHALGMATSLPGIPATLTENGDTPYEGIILGQYQSRPLDMAIALSTLANEGVWHQPHFVERVETGSGEVLYEAPGGEGERRVSEAVANNLMYAMQPIASYSGGALNNGRISAAKTGTTQLGDTGNNRDAWMVGATPQLATVVWVGSADNSPILTPWGGNMYGAGLPTDIWKDILDTSLLNEPVEYFPDPEPINWGNGLSISNGNSYVPPPVTYNPAPAPAPESTAGEATGESEAPAPSAGETPAPEGGATTGATTGAPTPEGGTGGGPGGGGDEGIEIIPGLVIPEIEIPLPQ